MIGVRIVRNALNGHPCPFCGPGMGGTHKTGCLVAEALTHDPVFVREARAEKEADRG